MVTRLTSTSFSRYDLETSSILEKFDNASFHASVEVIELACFPVIGLICNVTSHTSPATQDASLHGANVDDLGPS